MSENFESTYESSFGNNVISGGQGTDTISFGSTRPSQDFWYGDGISFTGSPYITPATGSPYIIPDSISPNLPNTFTIKSELEPVINDTNKNGFWKYNEDKILKQLEQYIAGTYSQHYVDRTGGGTEQTLDKIKHNRREGFCAGNITKYTDRYDTKGTPRADLFKVLHYTILLINHLNLVENK
jgi:hypothetical protein